MKKLFLTSGIIACMACPAFANPAVSGFDTTQSNANSTSTASGECVSTSIGTTHDSATLVAQWIENFHVMELNENDGNQSAAQGGATGATYDTSEPSNDNLWLTPYDSSTNEGGGVYTRANNPNGGYTFTKAVANDVVITAPSGIDVTYDLDLTSRMPQGYSSTPTAQTPSSENRAFLGYYANGTTNSTINNDTTNGNRMIDATGRLTALGVTDADTYDNDAPWIALYELVSPTVSDPTAYGYHFNGWYVGNGSTLYSSSNLPGNIGVDTDLVADWSAIQYAVSYVCGTGASGSASGKNGTATFDQAYTWASNNDANPGANDCYYPGKHFIGWTCTTTSTSGSTLTLTSNGTNYVDDNDASTLSDQNPGNRTGTTVTGGTWTFANVAETNGVGSAVTCTAQWADNVIQLSWTDPVGGNATTQNTCTYSGDVTIPADPRRTGYTFNGWLVE